MMLPRHALLTYTVFIAITVGISSLIGVSFTPGQWYETLTKPAFNPPSWVFGPVWTVLYIFIGIAGARTFLTHKQHVSMRWWVIQMLLNWLWSPLFFGMQQPMLALACIVAIWISIVAYIKYSWHIDRMRSYLFMPYLAWVSFATLLNASIVFLNI